MQKLLVVLAAAMCALLGWAAAQGGGGAAIAWLTTQPWGIVSLADLYLGFTCFGILVWRLEGSATRALAWYVPTLLLGNPVPALYLILNLHRIAPLLRGAANAPAGAATPASPA